jgi:threonine dehydrogenase-like Zn-dependent dehydrogenase
MNTKRASLVPFAINLEVTAVAIAVIINSRREHFASRRLPPDELLPSRLDISDVPGTGWFAADAENVEPESTVVVVGDGAVGKFGILTAKQTGASKSLM